MPIPEQPSQPEISDAQLRQMTEGSNQPGDHIAEKIRQPQPPLTDADIAKLEDFRGKPVTQEERRFMDMARAAGNHHSIV